MKQLLTELERASVRRQLWELCQALPLKRRDRLLYRERLWQAWLDNWYREQEEAERGEEHPNTDNSISV